MKTRTARRGRRTRQKATGATAHCPRPRKSFLLRSESQREGGEDEENPEKGTSADCEAAAARRSLRRDAERTAMRDLADAGRTGKADALPASKHLGAVAPSAEAGVRRIHGGQAATQTRVGPAW